MTNEEALVSLENSYDDQFGDRIVVNRSALAVAIQALRDKLPPVMPEKTQDSGEDSAAAFTPHDAILFVGVPKKNFRCNCGANVFTQYGANLFRCNGCGEEYTSKDE